MSITVTGSLGTTTLNDHVSRRRKYNTSNIPGSEEVTLGGRTTINRLAGSSNPEIVIEAIEEDNIRKGYFLPDQLDDLEYYRDEGEQVVLNYHGESFNVVIPIEGINVEKVLWKSQDSSDEKYLGSISFKRT